MTKSYGLGAISGRGLLLGATALTMIFATSPVRAQTTDSASEASATSEVVVTATRRGAQNIQDIPEAVDAFSGRTLERLQIQSMQDLSKVDPSLAIQSFGVSNETIIIRGISSTTGATTGVYLNEAPLKGGFNANINGDNTPVLALHDISDVEVLKGPQGTLFGSGSMDGTLRVVTNLPNLQRYEGFAEGSAADVAHGNALFNGDAVVNIPIVQDKLAIRAVAWDEDGGGFINQTISGVTHYGVNDEHMYGGRLEVLFKPIDRLSILASINYQNAKVDGSQDWTKYVGSVAAPGGTPTGPYGPLQNHSYTQEPDSYQYTLYTVTGTYDLGFGNLIGTSTYGYKHELDVNDTSPTDCSFTLCQTSFAFPAAFIPDSKFLDYTDEIRFSSNFKGPFQIVAGVYYEHDALDYNEAVIHANALSGAAPCFTYTSCTADGLAVAGFHGAHQSNSVIEFANQDRFNVDQEAYYAQADYKILPNLTATAGVRYFTAHLNDTQYSLQNIAPTVTPTGFDGGFFLGGITTPYQTSHATSDESKTTYNFSLLWKVIPDVSLYARTATGFRIGGVNEGATIAAQEGTAVPAAYGPDTLTDYEVGSKVYLLDRRLFLDLSVYHIDWTGEQEDALAGAFNYTLNVGKTSITGVELTSTYHVMEGLTLGGSLTYVDAHLAQDLPATVVDAGTPGVSGDRQPFVPHWSFTGSGEYEHPVADGVKGYLQGDFTYRSDSFSAFEPSSAAEIAAGSNNQFTELPSYFLVDMKAGVRFGNYDVGIYVQNLTNKDAYLGVTVSGDAVRVFSPRPRTIGIHASAHF